MRRNNTFIIQFYDDLPTSERHPTIRTIRSKAAHRNASNPKVSCRLGPASVMYLYLTNDHQFVPISIRPGRPAVLMHQSLNFALHTISIFPGISMFPLPVLTPSACFSVFFLGASCSFPFVVSVVASWRISDRRKVRPWAGCMISYRRSRE